MAIRGFELNTDHDLNLDAGGRFTFVSGTVATGQEVDTRLRFFRGESFTDSREGMPYFQEIFKKGTPPERVIDLIRQTIKSVPAVIDVPVCTIATDPATRKAVVVWEARENSGLIIKSEDFPPLILG